MARSLHAGRETWLHHQVTLGSADPGVTGHALCDTWTGHTAALPSAFSLRHCGLGLHQFSTSVSLPRSSKVRILSKQLFWTAICWLSFHELISRKKPTFLASMAPISQGSIPVLSRDLSFPRKHQQLSLDRLPALFCHHSWLQLTLMVPQTTSNPPRTSGSWLNSEMRQAERDPDLPQRWARCVPDALGTAYGLLTVNVVPLFSASYRWGWWRKWMSS